ncbi:hypothetical protein [Kitasatospora sp. NPDC097691]|uniref:hypothetical protein n=1 Tax=Kitasatospora sp. NPDC097691 TaxID=3157231 RepID=UPI003323802F
MASEFRTKDGRKVGFGDHVWSQNGDGPFIITPHPLDTVHLELLEVDGSEQRTHHPDDITLYYYASIPPRR